MAPRPCPPPPIAVKFDKGKGRDGRYKEAGETVSTVRERRIVPGADPHTPGEPKAEPFSVANLLKAQQRLLTAAPQQQPPGVPPETSPQGLRATDSAQFGTREYLDVILRRWPYVAFPLVVVPVLALLHASLQEQEWAATARILLTRSIVGNGIVDDMSGGVYVTSTALSQMAALETVRRRAARAASDWAAGDEKGLLGRLWSSGASPRWKRRDLGPEEMAVLASPDAVFDLLSRSVLVIPDTQNVTLVITARHKSRLVASALADALAAAIVDEYGRLRAEQSSTALIRAHMEANRQELERVNRELTELRREAAQANESLEGFPLEVEKQYELLKEHMFDLRSLDYMIEESEKLISFLSARVERLVEKAPPPEGLVQRLIDLELEREQAATRYTENHPKMQKLAEEIEQAKRAVAEFPKRRQELGMAPASAHPYADPAVQLAAEEAKLAGLKARREKLEATARAVRSEIQKTAAQERGLRYELLLTDRRVLQETAVALRTRLQRAEMTEGRGGESAGGIVKPVPAETRVAGQRLWMTVVLGVLVGALAGMLLAFMAERLDETVRLPAELRALTGLPTLQVVPQFRRTLTIRPEETVSGIANVFAVLRNNIRYSGPGSPERCVMITSAVPGEGKSLIALNLAISFAQEGNRTCLVDADLQKGERHAMEEAVKLASEPHSGLSTFLENRCELEDVLVPSLELPSLFFVGSGGRAANPPRVLRGERAAAFFQGLMGRFDVVVVDAPPILPVADAGLLAGHCVATIIVARYGYTRRAELEEAVRRLRHVGAPLAGLVLNCARRDSAGYYSRRYYSHVA